MGNGNLLGKTNKLQENDLHGLASCPGGVAILLVTSCYSSYDAVGFKPVFFIIGEELKFRRV